MCVGGGSEGGNISPPAPKIITMFVLQAYMYVLVCLGYQGVWWVSDNRVIKVHGISILLPLGGE